MHVQDAEPQTSETLLPYHAPLLRPHGALRDLTAVGSGNKLTDNP